MHHALSQIATHTHTPCISAFMPSSPIPSPLFAPPLSSSFSSLPLSLSLLSPPRPSLSSSSLALSFSPDCPPIVMNNTNQTKTGTESHLIWHHLQVLVRWHPYRLEYDIELILVIFALQESLSPQDLRKDAPDRPANHQERVTVGIGTSSTVSPKSLSQ